MIALALLCVLIFGPTLLAYARAVAEARGARDGSIVAEAESHFPWAAALLTIDPLCIGALWFALDGGCLPLSAVILLLLLAGKIGFVTIQRRALRKLRRLGVETAALAETYGLTGPCTRVSDVGVGEAWRGRALALAGYREAPQLSRLVIGDPDAGVRRVRDRLRHYLVLHAALYGPIFLASAWAVLAP